MTDDMLGPSPMHIKYSSYVYTQVSAPGDLSSSHEVGPVGVLWAQKSSPKR